MYFLYNILQLVFLPVFLPFIMLFVAGRRKYLDRLPRRLGLGLPARLPAPAGGCRFWLHALSVGEVTSAVPLAAGLRTAYPDSLIVVSVTTATGRKVADSLLADIADTIIDGPIDLLPVVRRFLRCLQPDLFILVETDFWPNLLFSLKKRGIPTLLVNGRISSRSMNGYRRWRFFFRSVFASFTCLAMQTGRDRDNMLQFGVPPEKLPILGNLKFAARTAPRAYPVPNLVQLLPPGRLLFLAGSTHPGEERMLLESYVKARALHPELYLLVAPRDPGRSQEIEELAGQHGLTVVRRSTGLYHHADIFLIDSLGELSEFYRQAGIAFVGGSLVAKGGHNPVEPAAMGIPVLFGPDMADFSEIADALIAAGGAQQVEGVEDLTEKLIDLLQSPEQRRKAGERARQCVEEQRDVIARHLQLIDTLL